MQAQTASVERQSEIGRELTGQMQHTSSAPIYPVHLDSTALECFIIRPDVRTAARPAHTDRRWMLAQDQNRPPLFPEFEHNAALKLLDLREVDQPQHVNFQRRQLRGWPHRQSVIAR